MKITKEGLKNLIKEELADLLKENYGKRYDKEGYPAKYKLARRGHDPLRAQFGTFTLKSAKDLIKKYGLKGVTPEKFLDDHKDSTQYDVEQELKDLALAKLYQNYENPHLEEINRLDRDEHQREMQKSHEEKMRPQPEKLEKHYREKLEKHYRGMHARYGGRRQMDGEYIDSELPDPDALASLSLEELEGALEELEAREDARAEMYQASKP